MKVEIQIRSILQHAWAEIEHDLGYKSQEAVPVPFRRRFSRLAGLLEIGDAEFASLRDGLRSYQRGVAKKVRSESTRISLDAASLRAYREVSPHYKRVNEAYLHDIGSKERKGPAYPNPEVLLRLFNLVGLKSTDDLDAALAKTEPYLAKFRIAYRKRLYHGRPLGSQPPGRILHTLGLYLLSHAGQPALESWLHDHPLGPPTRQPASVQALLDSLKEVTAEQATALDSRSSPPI